MLKVVSSSSILQLFGFDRVDECSLLQEKDHLNITLSIYSELDNL